MTDVGDHIVDVTEMVCPTNVSGFFMVVQKFLFIYLVGIDAPLYFIYLYISLKGYI